MTARVVAIDGPAGSGKSTVARGVAAALDVPILDTGAMYRAVTLAALQSGVDLADGDAVAAVAWAADIVQEEGGVVLDGRDVCTEIRGPEVTGAVSQVSAHPPVRALLVERQRRWVGDHDGAVLEGRDIGTVVLPDAPLKVFITARDDVRATRRQQDEAAAARAVAVENVRDALNDRDAADATLGRATRPEDAAADALVLDTSDMTAQEVIDVIVAEARNRAVTFYRFARAVVLSLFKMIFRVRVVGMENVPPSGVYIVAPSHRSNLDVPFAAFVTKRDIRFLAKQELFTPGFGEKVFNWLGAIPVERGTADRSAMRAIEEALEGGSVVGLFPEGTRKRGPGIADLFDGTAYLAVKLGVPILPVGIGGSEAILAKGKKLPRLHRVVVSVGKPIVPPVLEGRTKRAAASRLTQELHAELQRVFSDAERLAR